MLSWIDRANSEPTLIERMRALLRESDHVSFAELDQLDGFCGDQALTFHDQPNLVVWTGVSPEAAEALSRLLADGDCRIGAASLFTYLVDGKTLNLPVAKTARGYKKPRWFPAVLVRA